jgi:hypothetical protein
VSTVTVPSANASRVPDLPVGSVVLRGVAVAIDTDVGRAFVVDCARNTEGLMSDTDLKSKYELSDEDWEKLASNTPLLLAVRAERERRIVSGDAVREAAQRYFAKAPSVLRDILANEQVSPRHRIEAARELRQVVGDVPATASDATEKFVITINLGEDKKLIFEKEITPRAAMPSDDWELQ